MKMYVKPSCEVVNILTESVFMAGSNVPGTHDAVGNKQQLSNKKSMWDQSNDILGK